MTSSPMMSLQEANDGLVGKLKHSELQPCMVNPGREIVEVLTEIPCDPERLAHPPW
jgi:hypothetical protein